MPSPASRPGRRTRRASAPRRRMTPSGCRHRWLPARSHRRRRHWRRGTAPRRRRRRSGRTGSAGPPRLGARASRRRRTWPVRTASGLRRRPGWPRCALPAGPTARCRTPPCRWPPPRSRAGRCNLQSPPPDTAPACQGGCGTPQARSPVRRPRRRARRRTRPQLCPRQPREGRPRVRRRRPPSPTTHPLVGRGAGERHRRTQPRGEKRNEEDHGSERSALVTAFARGQRTGVVAILGG